MYGDYDHPLVSLAAGGVGRYIPKEPAAKKRKMEDSTEKVVEEATDVNVEAPSEAKKPKLMPKSTFGNFDGW